jgi:diacylglycerol kinase (ATP)
LKKVFVLVNPVSGKGKSLKALALLRDLLDANEIQYAVFQTEKNKNGWQTVASHLDKHFSDLIILGGDGTINEAVNGLKYDIPVSIVPCGTGNDYVKCLKIGKHLKEQINTAVFGHPIPVDVGVCNDRKFLNGVGIGFDGQIVFDLVTQKTWIQGVAKYYYHVLKILSSYKAKPFSFLVDGQTNTKPLILLCIAKGTTFGGAFRLVPNSKLDDGKLHVCEIGDLKPLKRFLNIGRLGKGSHFVLKEVKNFTSEKLIVHSQPQLHAHIDGEYFGNPPFAFGVLPKSLKIRAYS